MKILEGTVASVPPQGGRKHPHQEFIQIDTTNILLFVVEPLTALSNIKRRLGQKCRSKAENKIEDLEKEVLLSKVLPEDLLRFGLIPEFIGRLPLLQA
ncbi:hypothetical protein ACEQPO_20855 [Bacillus sp. SL00103]